jgi:hypothetical protein
VPVLPSTVTSLVILALAVLPGAVYVWSFERETGPFGASFADRILRFLAASAFIHVLAALPEYTLYRVAVHGSTSVGYLQFFTLWIGATVLISVPAICGHLVGRLWVTRNSPQLTPNLRKLVRPSVERVLLRTLVGRQLEPRAWDYIFSTRSGTFVRVRTTSGTWLAGVFASNSYAAGFLNEADLFLENAYSLDEATLGLKDWLPYGIYLPAAQIAWMELIPPSIGEEENGE